MVQKGLRIRLGRAHMLVVTPGKIALYLGMAVLAVFMALPLLYVAVTAFKPYEELFLFPPRFFVKNPTMDNWANLMGAFDSSSVPFLKYLFNSLLTTVVSVALTILVCALAAYGFAKKRVPFGNALFTLIIMALSFPVHATQIPNYMIVNALGPVSYTHLDVYKRQAINPTKVEGGGWAAVAVNKPEGFDFRGTKGVVTYVRSVSYTHLSA